MTSMTTARREAIIARVRALNAALNPARKTYLAEARRRAAEGRASAYEAYEAYRMATQAAWDAHESAGTDLMPAEAAYAHLAQFAKGDRVTVGGRIYPSEAGIVTGPQRHDYSHILRSDITVTIGEGDDEQVRVITVASHLSGHRTISRAA